MNRDRSTEYITDIRKLKRTKRMRQDRFIPKYVSKTNFDMKNKTREFSMDKDLENFLKTSNRRKIIPGILFNNKENVVGNSQKKLGSKKRVLSFQNEKRNNHFDLSFKNGKFITTKQTHGFNAGEIKILQVKEIPYSFYYNILDISNKDRLAIGIGKHAYLFNEDETGICSLNERFIGDDLSCVSFPKVHDNVLSVASLDGKINLIDTTKSSLIRTIKAGNHGRIIDIDWSGSLMANTSQCGNVQLRDIRERSDLQNSIYLHSAEVCRIKFSPFDSNLFLTGGNDNVINVYDIRNDKVLMKSEKHKSAVKALTWSNTKRSTFLSGGGKDDRKMYVWDLNRKDCLGSLNIQSQICNMDFTCDDYLAVSCGQVSDDDDEVIGKDCIYLIDIKKMKVLCQYEGHHDRILYSVMNSRKDVLITASSDETVRTWDVRNKIKKQEELDRKENRDMLKVSLR